MDRRPGPNRDAVLLVDDLRLLVIEFMDFGSESPNVRLPEPPRDVPGEHLLHVPDRGSGPELRRRAARSPHSQRRVPPGNATADEESAEIAEMISMQMADEDFVQPIVRDLQSGKPLGPALPDVEDELVAVAELDEEACRCRRR